MNTKTIHTLGIATCALAASLLFLTTGCNANAAPSATTPPANTPATAPGKPATAAAKSPVTVIPDADTNSHNNWTESQILTCSVSQCWQLSGKNEDNFFDIVQQLAVISAKNRNLTLPETEAAGQQTGEYIKDQARKDRQQLLYAVVDDAIRKVGTPNQSN
jgi:ABC-type uncharacterized transport system involved in gliding motility auxiliary subunit